MKFVACEIPGAWIVESESHRDERGSFGRTFCEREFAEAGLVTRFRQCSLSTNARRGTLRGLHYQDLSHPETKLVRCTRGSIFDVVVDLREGSTTRGRWFGVELSAKNQRALYVPAGFAHGFQTLEDDSELLYMIDEFYVEGLARGVRWNDSRVGVRWPLPDPILSPRDRGLPEFV